MKIKEISLTNFKNFIGKHTFSFDKMTLIAGINGTGKSTIIEALIFAIWGYTPKGKLEDICTRDKAKSFNSVAVIEEKGHIYEVSRSYPLKISIKVDGKAVQQSTAEANAYLISVFGTREFFTKFILLDAGNPETNMLELGQVALKRIIFAGTDERFNRTREKISTIKQEREKLNADDAVIYKHYPSELRLEVLTREFDKIYSKATEIEKEIYDTEKEIRAIENRMLTAKNKQENLLRKKEDLNKETSVIVKQNICYACKRPLEETVKQTLFIDKDAQNREIDKELEIISGSMPDYKEGLDNLKSILDHEKKIQSELTPTRDRIAYYMNRLETRLEQKQYIYSERDVLVAKKAIEELDKMSSYYLVESVRTLEPIINSVLDKISFKCSFECDLKGKFNILLDKEGIQYKYADLSTGEKLILQIAFKLAILMRDNRADLLICDEGLGSLAEDNLNHILEIIKSLNTQIIMVLHRYEPTDADIKIIQLTK